MDDAARLKSLCRAVRQQCLLRDRALAARAGIEGAARALALRETAILQAIDPLSPIGDILLSSGARSLESVARERARLEAIRRAEEETAARHGRLARAGERRLVSIERERDARVERSALEALAEKPTGATSPA